MPQEPLPKDPDPPTDPDLPTDFKSDDRAIHEPPESRSFDLAAGAGAEVSPAMDYDDIRRAVVETERGRWFLLQYAARNRNADTAAVLAALDRIERLMRARGSVPAEAPLPAAARQGAVGTGAELAAAADGHCIDRNSAVAAIRDAVEHIQEISWFMHEHNLDRALCANLDAAAAEISRACALIERAGEKIADETGPAVVDFAPEAEAAAGITQTVPPAMPEREMTAPADEEAAALILSPAPDEPAGEAVAEFAAASAPEHPQSVAAAIPDAESAVLSDAAQLFPPVAKPQGKPAANRAGWLSELLAHGGRQVQPEPRSRTEVQPAWPGKPASQAAPGNDPAWPAATPAPAQVVPLPRPAPAAAAEPKPAPAQSDPLAPVMALSDEEKIALFS